MKVRVSTAGLAIALLLTSCQRQRPVQEAELPQEAQRTIVPPAAGAADDLRPPPAPSDTLTPSPTPTLRSLTPEPVTDIHGACPTVTPRPEDTEEP